MNCSCGKKNCRCGGKKSSMKVGKYAEGGVVASAPATAQPAMPLTNPAQGQFAQGANKYLDMIQQRRAAARSQFGQTAPGNVMNKYFPKPPEAPATGGQPTDDTPFGVRRGDGPDMRANRAPTSRTAGGFASSGLASRLPGGVNTRNPSSKLNQTAARMTSKPQRAPTAADRPKSRPSGGKKK